METPRRTTVYLDPALHQALRTKAAASDRTVSDLVNEAVGLTLAEDAEDLAAALAARHEPTRSLEEVEQALRRRGRL